MALLVLVPAKSESLFRQPFAECCALHRVLLLRLSAAPPRDFCRNGESHGLRSLSLREITRVCRTGHQSPMQRCIAAPQRTLTKINACSLRARELFAPWRTLSIPIPPGIGTSWMMAVFSATSVPASVSSTTASAHSASCALGKATGSS